MDNKKTIYDKLTSLDNSEDIQEVVRWTDDVYDSTFADYFKGQREIYKKLKSHDNLITDSELEWILANTPLDLFSAVESLSAIKAKQEVIKIELKKKKADIASSFQSSFDMSKTEAKEEAELAVHEDKILISAYDAIIDRVSREMSFSKELVMSAKKIWDARRGSDSIPMGVDDSEQLPEYNYSNSQYIK